MIFLTKTVFALSKSPEDTSNNIVENPVSLTGKLYSLSCGSLQLRRLFLPKLYKPGNASRHSNLMTPAWHASRRCRVVLLLVRATRRLLTQQL